MLRRLRDWVGYCLLAYDHWRTCGHWPDYRGLARDSDFLPVPETILPNSAPNRYETLSDDPAFRIAISLALGRPWSDPVVQRVAFYLECPDALAVDIAQLNPDSDSDL